MITTDSRGDTPPLSTVSSFWDPGEDLFFGETVNAYTVRVGVSILLTPYITMRVYETHPMATKKRFCLKVVHSSQIHCTNLCLKLITLWPV